MAEYVMKDLVERNGVSECFYIDSAATSTEEIGNGVHYGTRKKLLEVGVFCGDHRAVQLKRSDYDKYDYFLGMDTWNIQNMHRILGKDSKGKIHRLLDFGKNPRDIADPWYTGDFDRSYDDIVEGCQTFLNYLRSEIGPTFADGE